MQSVITLGGAARTGTLVKLGHPPRRISEAVRAKILVRVSRGLYAVPGVRPEQLHAARLNAQITCVSALASHGVALLHQPDRPHLAVPGNFATHARHTGRMRLHYTKGFQPQDSSAQASTTEALICASGCLGKKEHLVAFDSALHLGLVRPDEIAPSISDGTEDQVQACAHRSRRAWLVAFADARAESPLETLVRVALAEAGLRVHPQRFIEGVGRVDLVVEGALVVETDGREHHDDPRAFQRDRERDRRLTRLGFKVLRFTYADLMGAKRVNVVDEVQETLRRGSSRRR